MAAGPRAHDRPLGGPRAVRAALRDRLLRGARRARRIRRPPARRPHPAASRIRPPRARRSDCRRAVPLVAVLPGSRRGEVARLGPPFAATLAWLACDAARISASWRRWRTPRRAQGFEQALARARAGRARAPRRRPRAGGDRGQRRGAGGLRHGDARDGAGEAADGGCLPASRRSRPGCCAISSSSRRSISRSRTCSPAGRWCRSSSRSRCGPTCSGPRCWRNSSARTAHELMQAFAAHPREPAPRRQPAGGRGHARAAGRATAGADEAARCPVRACSTGAVRASSPESTRPGAARWPGRWSPPRSSSIRRGRSRDSPIPRRSRRRGASRWRRRSARAAWPGGSAGPTPPRSTRSTSCRPRSSRCGARCWRSTRAPAHVRRGRQPLPGAGGLACRLHRRGRGPRRCDRAQHQRGLDPRQVRARRLHARARCRAIRATASPRHKGYPTAAHLAALRRLGPSPVHRRSFAPVQSCDSPDPPEPASRCRASSTCTCTPSTRWSTACVRIDSERRTTARRARGAGRRLRAHGHAGRGGHRPGQPVRAGQVLPRGAGARASSRWSASICCCAKRASAPSRRRLVLLCQDERGYRNLTRLVTRAYLEGQGRQGRPLSSAPGSTPRPPRASSRCPARATATSAGRCWRAARTRPHGALEALARGCSATATTSSCSAPAGPGEEDCIARLARARRARAACRWSRPTTCASSRREDFESHEARVCIHEGALLADPRAPRRYSEQQYLRSPEEMAELFADLPEALDNTVEIARRCNLEVRLGKPSLPAYPVPGGRHARRSTCARRRAPGSRPRLARRIGARPPGPAGRLRRAARERARRDLPDGLRRLLPDRRGLHPLGARERRAGGARPRLGRGLAGRLGARHHRPRPAALRPAVRALPESRARVDARLRRRLLHGRPRPGDRLRRRALRPRARLADHHLRHDGGEGGGARRGARARPQLRLRRQHRQADPLRARHHARRRARQGGGAAARATRPRTRCAR